MRRIEVTALAQNASTVVADAASGTRVIITDRGLPVAQMLPVSGGGLRTLERAGLVRRRRYRLAGVPAPLSGVGSLSGMVGQARDDERY